MPSTKLMINGLPGNVTRMLAQHVMRNADFELLPYSLTGPEIEAAFFEAQGRRFELIRPEQRDRAIEDLRESHPRFISIDFTHPAAVNSNANFYCTHRLPFVMGTTGGDREQLQRTVEQSAICAVIAPNMAKQIVGLQAMMAYGAETFPGLFRGYSLTVRESHQQGKADTSGTAKAMVGYFKAMGVAFADNQIQMERDPEIQRTQWGIPEAHLRGHGWHTYALDSPDATTHLELRHNINGREIYAEGTLAAVRFLVPQVEAGCHGKVFSMIDVLRAGV